MNTKKISQPSSRQTTSQSRSKQATPRINSGQAKKSPSKRTSSRPTSRSGRPSSKKSSSRPRKSFGRNQTSSRKQPSDTVPPVAQDTLRIVPLGGVEEVGRNMTAVEYGDDIIIVDCGFGFPGPDTPGIDYLLPTVDYLFDKKDKIRGVFITHGHYDHIGAIPFVMAKIGNPPIYTRQFGALIIQKRQLEFPDEPELDMRILEGGETISAGVFDVETFSISHTIPDSMGLVIHTPLGKIAFIEDVRVDNVDGKPSKEEVEQYQRFKKDKDILLLTMDSTSIEKQGWSVSEVTVIKNIDKIIKDAPGRLIIGAFASQVERLMEIVKLAKKYNKRIVVDGRSMKSNMEVARELGLYDPSILVPIDDIDEYPPSKIVMIATGAQGEQYSVFDRLVRGQYRHLKLTDTDTVLLSASIVPGNEHSVNKIKDGLYRSPARIITYRDSDVHASGHGNREELKWIHTQIPYKFFIPVHGNHFMLRMHADMANQELGVSKENIVVPDNGSVIEIAEDSDGELKIAKRKERAPYALTTVDGSKVSDSQGMVLRDRQALAEDGMFVLVASLDRKGSLKKSPDIISRGFVYLKESQELLHKVRGVIKKTIQNETKGKRQLNIDNVKNALAEHVTKFLLQQTGKRPIVIPVVLNV